MSLDWTNKNPRPEWTEIHAYAREAIIFRTMFLGINPITEDNVRKFFGRGADWDEANGAAEPYLSLEECMAGIGVASNASTLTDAAFERKLAKIRKDREEQAERDAYRVHASNYAAKFAAETVCYEPPRYEEPTDENLKARLNDCGIRPRKASQLAQIREAFNAEYYNQIAAARK